MYVEAPYGFAAVDVEAAIDDISAELVSPLGRTGTPGAAGEGDVAREAGTEVVVAGRAAGAVSTAVAPALSHGFGGEGILLR